MKILFALAIILSFNCSAQTDTVMIRMESEIFNALRELRHAKSDGEKEMKNISLYAKVKQALSKPNILTYPFDRLTSMSTLKSPDGAFRLFNWNIESDQLTHKHYCLMVKKGKSNQPNTIIEFKEDKITIPPNPRITLTPNKWYGALYYKIIPIKKGAKMLYTIMGFSGNSRSSNKKVLDVFWFKGSNLRLGYPLFEESHESKRLLRRVFFEYSEKASMSLKFIPDIGKIVFSHLMPETKNLKGMYEYYIPDLTFDAYYWRGGVWKYQKDIQVGNRLEKKTKHYYVDAEGNTVYKESRNKWVDPNGEGSAGSDGNHQTVEIENDGNGNTNPGKKKNKKSSSKKTKKRKKNPQSAIRIKK